MSTIFRMLQVNNCDLAAFGAFVESFYFSIFSVNMSPYHANNFVIFVYVPQIYLSGIK